METSRPLLYILGAGGHCLQAVDAARLAGWRVASLFDDAKTGSWGGVEILGPLSAVSGLEGLPSLHCAVGDNAARQSIYQRFPHNPWPNCSHPQSFFSPMATAGEGNYFGGGCRVLAGASVGCGNIFNEGCLATHECVLGDFNHLAPGSCLGGWVRLGDRNLIGLNSTLLPRTCLGSDNVVGAGAVVLRGGSDRDPPSRSTLVGNPARLVPGGGKWIPSDW